MLYRTYIKLPNETTEYQVHKNPVEALRRYRDLAARRTDGPAAAVLTDGTILKKRTRLDRDYRDDCRVEIDEIFVAEDSGAEVRRLREAAGLTQTALAAKIGMSMTSICRIESGQQTLTKSTELAIRSVCEKLLTNPRLVASPPAAHTPGHHYLVEIEWSDRAHTSGEIVSRSWYASSTLAVKFAQTEAREWDEVGEDKALECTVYEWPDDLPDGVKLGEEYGYAYRPDPWSEEFADERLCGHDLFRMNSFSSDAIAANWDECEDLENLDWQVDDYLKKHGVERIYGETIPEIATRLADLARRMEAAAERQQHLAADPGDHD